MLEHLVRTRTRFFLPFRDAPQQSSLPSSDSISQRTLERRCEVNADLVTSVPCFMRSSRSSCRASRRRTLLCVRHLCCASCATVIAFSTALPHTR